MRNVANITRASNDGSWQASAWLLERRCPDEFVLRNDLNITNEKIAIVNDVPKAENKHGMDYKQESFCNIEQK